VGIISLMTNTSNTCFGKEYWKTEACEECCVKNSCFKRYNQTHPKNKSTVRPYKLDEYY
jgi:hypothetical protein